jgi:hypothetical protein
MAFCKNCGTQLQGDERFCVGCGKDVSAKAAPGPVVNTPPVQAGAPVAAQGQAAAAPVAPGVAAAPGTYAAPGTIPIMVTMPAQAPAKRGGMIWVLVVVGVLVGAYYYLKPPPAPPPDPAALTKQQAFDARWDNVYGFVQISNGKWTNHATVPIDSAELECDQYNGSGTDLAQMRKTLPGPLQPGASTIYNPFQMGAVETETNKVTCTIVHVKAVVSGK